MTHAATLRMSLIAAGLGTVLLNGAPAFADTWEIDFNDLVNGQIVDDEYSASGISGTGLPKPGQLVSGLDVYFAGNLPNGGAALSPVVFDSTLDATKDPDLESPFTPSANAAANGLGVANPGNLLILHEDPAIFTNTNSPGGPCLPVIDPKYCESPDDIGARPAGVFTITFSSEVVISEIDFFDIENNGAEPGTVTLFDVADAIIGAGPLSIPETGNHKWDRLEIPLDDGFGVRRVEIALGGSGAFGSIRGRTPSQLVPEPTPLALIGLGLIAVAVRRRA